MNPKVSQAVSEITFIAREAVERGKKQGKEVKVMVGGCIGIFVLVDKKNVLMTSSDTTVFTALRGHEKVGKQGISTLMGNLGDLKTHDLDGYPLGTPIEDKAPYHQRW